MSNMKRFIRIFFGLNQVAAFSLWFFLIIFLSLEGFFGLTFFLKSRIEDPPLNRVTAKYGSAVMNAVYPESSPAEVNSMLQETWNLPFIFEPYTQFRERPRNGIYVNVDKMGFRHIKNQGPWPPDPKNLNIFLFGGSTAFGYGVSDEETIASHLQEILRNKSEKNVSVYNFGRGSYYSTQESVLYERLLVAGFVPDIAIFIDGLNDFALAFAADEPSNSYQLRREMDGSNSRSVSIFFRLLNKTNIFRAIVGLKSHPFMRNNILKRSKNEPESQGLTTYDDPEVLDRVIKRYLGNKRVIEGVSRSFGVDPIFVWQPVPNYHYDPQLHPFISDEGFSLPSNMYCAFGYRIMSAHIQDHPMGDHFLWAADLQLSEHKPLYVDQVHYSDYFSKKIAAFMADSLSDRGFLAAHSGPH